MNRIDIATKYYERGNASLEKAAHISGLSISEFIDELSRRNIESNVTLEDFDESLKNLKKIMKE